MAKDVIMTRENQKSNAVNTVAAAGASHHAFSDELVEIISQGSMDKVGALSAILSGAKKAKGVIESYGQQRGRDLVTDIGDKVTKRMHVSAIQKANRAKLDRLRSAGEEFTKKYERVPRSHPVRADLIRASKKGRGPLSILRGRKQSKVKPGIRRLSSREINKRFGPKQPSLSLTRALLSKTGMSKEERRERMRDAARHSAAALVGTGAGVAAGSLAERYIKKRHPRLEPVIRHKASKYGIPAMLAAGSAYASHKYKKNLNEAFRRARDEQ